MYDNIKILLFNNMQFFSTGQTGTKLETFCQELECPSTNEISGNK
jgi:hypothetical protein